MFAAEHFLDLDVFDLQLDGVERALQIGTDRLACLRPFEQHADVVDLPRQAVALLDVLGQAALALQRLLGLALVVPEVLRRDFLLELR